ncbi:hypothetical protein FHR91_001677 [Erythrobacter lutimaris]|nr:hypothetical protein [Alteriqipengyuania lutimaris]
METLIGWLVRRLKKMKLQVHIAFKIDLKL